MNNPTLQQPNVGQDQTTNWWFQIQLKKTEVKIIQSVYGCGQQDNSSANAGFLDQNYHYKSVVTKIPSMSGENWSHTIWQLFSLFSGSDLPPHL